MNKPKDKSYGRKKVLVLVGAVVAASLIFYTFLWPVTLIEIKYQRCDTKNGFIDTTRFNEVHIKVPRYKVNQYISDAEGQGRCIRQL